MIQYPKINTVWKRTREGELIEGQFSTPEFEYLANNEWYWTEKIDGTNIRVGWDALNKEIIFAGRTDRAQIPSFLLEKLEQIFTVDKLENLFPDTPLILFGEGYGARIQKVGKHYIPDGVDFILFDVRIGNWWLRRQDVEDIAKRLGIKVVPIVGEGTLLEGCELTRKGFKSLIGDCIAEGLVMKPKVQLLSRDFKPIIAKIKHKDFTKGGK